MSGFRLVAQACSLLYRRFATCGPLAVQPRPADCKSAIHQCATLRYAVGVLVLLSLVSAGLVFAQPAATNTVRFRAVDILVDSRGKPLAAYQLEFTATNGNARIVGIEGGGHPAFAQPPFYDPKAMQHERVIIAAFSTAAAEKLPTGKVRVATVHLETRVATEPAYETRLQTAAGADGRKIAAEASSEERKSK